MNYLRNISPQWLGISPTNTQISQASKNRWSDNNFSFKTVTQKEVQKLLQNLNPRKAIGHNEIPPLFLKLASAELESSLTNIYNQAITNGEWSNEWKRGEWIPVFKKGDRDEKANS